MNKLIIFTYILLTMALLPAQPVWFSRPASVYSPNDYITGVGEGSTYDEALKNAALSIEQQLSIMVRLSDNIDASAPAYETAPYLAAYIYQNSHKITDQQLNRVEVRQRLQVEGTYYILAVLLKNNVLSVIQRDVNNLWAKLQKEVQAAEQQGIDLQYITALSTYAKAQQTLFELCMKKLFYDNIAVRPCIVDEALSETYVEGYVKDLISSINFEVVSGNQQTTRNGTLLPEPITFYACAKKNGKNITLAKLPVSITYEDGTLIETGITKPDGTYKIYALGLSTTGERGKISIQIDPQLFPGFYNRILKNKTVSAHYQATDSPALLASLTVVDPDGLPLPAVLPHLTSILNTHNIKQSESAPVYIKGVADIFNKKTITEKWAVKNEVYVTIDLEFGIIATNEWLGTIRCKGEGVSERSEQEAINLAFINLNMSEKDLNYIVQKVQHKVTSFNEAVSSQLLTRGKQLYIEGKFPEAINTLLKVDVGEENIHEAVTLINIIKAYVRK